MTMTMIPFQDRRSCAAFSQSSPSSPALVLYSRRDTSLLGECIAHHLSGGQIILFVGDLGTGKTFLCRAILRSLGLPSSVRVVSPSFSLVQEYPSCSKHESPLLHSDLYRIKDANPARAYDELASLGLIDARRNGATLLIEWGLELLEAAGIKPDLRVTLTLGWQDRPHLNSNLSSTSTEKAREVNLEGPLSQIVSEGFFRRQKIKTKGTKKNAGLGPLHLPCKSEQTQSCGE